jgi:ABC-type nitrate/sulfonate/bicarbonate transport system ATPase subunit
MDASSIPTLRLTKVSKSYTSGHSQTRAIEDVTFDVFPGEFLCILGESGCGKSTLLQMIAGFEFPSEGEILTDGMPIKGPDHKRGIVFQEGSLLPWRTVERNISLGLEIRNQNHGSQARIAELIDLMGLRGFEKHYPAQLSGGMAQRVAIARALINDASVLLLDEPFGALDSFTRIRLQLELLRIWQQQKLTAIFVTHDIEEAVFLGTRLVVMSARPGRVARVFNIALRQPRDRSSPDFIRLRAMISKEFQTLTQEV